MIRTMITDKARAPLPNADFDNFIAQVQERFRGATGALFETDASGLYQAYLDACEEPAERQRRSCSCCRKFIERFGGLVTVGDDGRLVPVLWAADDAPAPYRAAAEAVARKVRKATITLPFLTSDSVLGTRDKGGWRHFAIPTERPFVGSGLYKASQVASAKRVAFDSVLRALEEYSPATCATALRLLKNDTLANAEAALGQAQFLVDLHAARGAASGPQGRDNLVYRMVAAAPEGFCHPRSSMIATLLDDIASGKTFEDAATRWAAKMHPLRYQRPPVAPSEGAIRAAEAAFEKLGAGTALQRRYATMADIQETIWLPPIVVKAPARGGLFAGIVAKDKAVGKPDMMVPAVLMTFEKFRRTVLPTADSIALAAPAGRATFVALTAAVHTDARPILQWDHEGKRNTVAWYVYHGGSLASEFNLVGSHYEVTAMTLKPHAWGGELHPHQGEGVLLLLKGARDLGKCGGHCALFPACLKGEFHGFRSTIEAYSRTHPLAGFGEDNVAGLLLAKGEQYGITLRVRSAGQVSDYLIDRWD